MSLIEEKTTRRHAAEIHACVERERQARVALGARVPRPGLLRIALAELLIRIGSRLEYGPPPRRLYLHGRGRGFGWSR